MAVRAFSPDAGPWLSPSLLARIVCPSCRASLERHGDTLQCTTCGGRYGFEHGIPVLTLGAPPVPPPSCTRELSVLMLAYNEGENLHKILPLVRAVLDDLGCDYEVVVVDGGSRDDTVERAQAHGARVHVQRQGGYGNAFREGIEACEGAYVLTLDADMSHDPGFIRNLWLNRAGADLTIGSRYVSGAEAEMTHFRRLLSLFMNGVFRRVLSIPVRDLSSGFRLYRRDSLIRLPLKGNDFDVLVEVLVEVFARGWSVQEIPMYYKPRMVGQSNLRVMRFGVSYWKSLLGLWPLRNSVRSADYDARAYHSPIPLQRYWQRERLRAVRELLGAQTDGILDVGCGSSKILQSLPSAVGLDVRIEKLRYMQRTNRLLVAGSILALPFADATFDTVICSQVIEHVRGRDCINELKRVLRPGGRLILGTPDYATWHWRAIEPIYDRMLPRAYAEEHIERYTRGSLHELLSRCGFDLVKERYVCHAEWIGLAVLRDKHP